MKNLRLQQVRELSLLLIFAVILLFFGTQINNYFSPRTFNRISGVVALITVVAVGQTLVVITRNVDLSVGSIVGFTAYFLGRQLSVFDGLNPVLAVTLAMGVGAGFGLLNGLLVAYGRIPSIVVTLGTLALYRGFLVEYSGSTSIATRDLPDWIKDLPRVTVFQFGELEMRVLPLIALVVVVVFQLVLIYTAFGRRLYAVGSSPEAAKMAGIPSNRLVMIAFVISGALSGLGGFIYLARIGTITVVAAQGLELQVVAAAVVGGVNIFGGSGTVFGALLGAILIGTIEQSLIRMRVNEFWKDALLGIFILGAVTTDSILLNRLRLWWATRRQSSTATSPEPEPSLKEAQS
ncbi:MAG: ABC transporter permease [Chloroflexota bacterium]